MDLSPADVGEGTSGQNVADGKRAEASSSGQGQQGESSHGPRTMSKASIMKMHEERIRKMGEKHGIEFGPSDIFSNDSSEMVDRVDKPIRMRVRRLCHQCDTLFSTNNKECSNCHHIRCNSCPRFPSKTKHDRGSANLEEMQAVMKVTREHSANLGNFLSGDYQVELKRLAETGGPGLVHRKPRQRVRRTCHECKMLFASGSRHCNHCGHDRCTNCTRYPYVFSRALAILPIRKSSLVLTLSLSSLFCFF